MVRARRALPDVDASSYPAASVPRGDSAGLVAVRSGEKRSGAKLDPAAAEDVTHCGVADGQPRLGSLDQLSALQ